MTAGTAGAITLTDEQRVVVDVITDWSDGPGDEFSCGGYAGTGKSTIARFVLDRFKAQGLDVAVLAPTGKAADVLRTKGLPADTVHSFVYDCIGQVKDRRTGLARPVFEAKAELFKEPDIIIVDESSMVNDEMARDLRALGIKILWIGDHGQLPPVGGDPGIMLDPDATLETIHRQAEDNPIIRLAHQVRRGIAFRQFRVPEDSRVRFVDTKPSPAAIVRECVNHEVDQVMCAFNNTRHQLNAGFRRALGFDGPIGVGERVMCLANAKDQQLYNGQFYRVTAVSFEDGGTIAVADLTGDDGRQRLGVPIWTPCLGRGRMADERVPDHYVLFDWGWVATVHKMQGSSARTVALVDQPCRQWDMARHRYTAVTRAEERLVVFR